MSNKLKYHHAIFDLLGIEPQFSSEAQAILAERERICDVVFPAAVKELFSIEGIHQLFESKTTPDYLVELTEIGIPEEVKKDYLKVAWENQGVVVWFVHLTGEDDPPVYHDNNEYFSPLPDCDTIPRDVTQINWEYNSATFTNFIYDMLLNFHFDGWNDGWYFSSQDVTPADEILSQLRLEFSEGPHTSSPYGKVWRFYTNEGQVRVTSNAAKSQEQSSAEWVVDTSSEDAARRIIEKIIRFGTLRSTLKAEGGTNDTRRTANELLRTLTVQL